jgi:hypothetical protein
MKNDLTKRRILAVVLGTSWSITLLAFIYIGVNADKHAKAKEEFLKAKIEMKVCQEHAETLSMQLGDRENQLRRSLAELEKTLVETRLAKEFAHEQSKLAMKRK